MNVRIHLRKDGKGKVVPFVHIVIDGLSVVRRGWYRANKTTVYFRYDHKTYCVSSSGGIAKEVDGYIKPRYHKNRTT